MTRRLTALALALAGLRPIVLERGQDAKARRAAVLEFWKTGTLDPECNVQFGEGGAGTFSDGKLNTGVKNERIGWILEQFAEAGASADILYDAKPHIGTDGLVTVVQNLREKILHYGGEVRFGVKVTGLVTEDGRVTGVRAAQGGEEAVIPASCARRGGLQAERAAAGRILGLYVLHVPGRVRRRGGLGGRRRGDERHVRPRA